MPYGYFRKDIDRYAAMELFEKEAGPVSVK